MRAWLVVVWLALLVLALVGGWVVWTHPWVFARLPRDELRLGIAAALLVGWGLLPVLFGGLFRRRGDADAPPNLREQRKALLALLRDRGLGGSRSRYALPFYVVLGPAGSGKSSLLDRSTLGFAAPARIGPWTIWTSDEAVCIEAGIGDAAGGPAELLAILKWLRPRLPLNGVIVVTSPADLALADRHEQRETAGAVALWLRELEVRLGGKVPTYLLLSKIDLVPGFIEFFDRQEGQERQQPWGFSLPYRSLSGPPPSAEVAESVTRGFRTLVDSMRTRLVEWLSRESDPARCSRIQGFGAQVANLQHAVRPIFDALQPESTRSWSGAALRGVFLTSARQEALSIDAMLPDLSTRFALPRIGMLPPDLGLEEEENGYFIGGAFRQAIYTEAGLVEREHGRRWTFAAQWTASGVIVAACAALAYLLLPVFDSQIRWPAYVQDAAAGIDPLANPSRTGDIPQIVSRIDRFAAMRQALGSETPAPSYAFGLEAARPLAADIAAGREVLLRNALMPHLVSILERQLSDIDADLAGLRGLLAIAEQPATIDAEALKAWLQQIAGALPEEARESFVGNALVAVRAAGGIAVDPAYIDAARRIIAYRESLT